VDGIRRNAGFASNTESTQETMKGMQEISQWIGESNIR
jgi:hypothetical protein